MSDHYFSADPVAPLVLRSLRVTLDGVERQLAAPTGVFSGDRMDPGTAILLDALPHPPQSGNLLDLGCGWGPIATTAALRSPGLRVWAVDVNVRALAATRHNAELLSLANITAATPDEVPPNIEFDAIWSNPPIRVGKQVLHSMLEHWIPRLVPGGSAWFVVQKHLGADSLQRWLSERFAGFDIERVTTKKNYRVLVVAAPLANEP